MRCNHVDAAIAIDIGCADAPITAPGVAPPDVSRHEGSIFFNRGGLVEINDEGLLIRYGDDAAVDRHGLLIPGFCDSKARRVAHCRPAADCARTAAVDDLIVDERAGYLCDADPIRAPDPADHTSRARCRAGYRGTDRQPGNRGHLEARHSRSALIVTVCHDEVVSLVSVDIGHKKIRWMKCGVVLLHRHFPLGRFRWLYQKFPKGTMYGDEANSKDRDECGPNEHLGGYHWRFPRQPRRRRRQWGVAAAPKVTHLTQCPGFFHRVFTFAFPWARTPAVTGGRGGWGASFRLRSIQNGWARCWL